MQPRAMSLVLSLEEASWFLESILRDFNECQVMISTCAYEKAFFMCKLYIPLLVHIYKLSRF